MAKLQGYLLEHKDDLTGESAVLGVPSLLLQSKPVPLCAMSCYSHLQRLGLERFAALFEHHGFMYKSQIDEAELKAKVLYSCCTHHTVLMLYSPYCTHAVLTILYSYCTHHTVLIHVLTILYSYQGLCALVLPVGVGPLRHAQVLLID
jgi:hypothetical protein